MHRLAKYAAFIALAGTAACNQETPTTDQAAMPENASAANEMQMNDPSNPYAASEMQMHEAMMAAKGGNVSQTWALKMIEHHRGAVTMSEVLLARDPDSRFADMARTVIQDQTAEIQKLQRMLQNADKAAVSEPASSVARPVAATAPEPRAKAPPAVKAKAATPPPPPADPHAGHDMDNMSNGM